MVGSQVLFSVARQDLGRELWRTDGTPGGTFLVKDFVPGAGDSNPTPLGTLHNHMLLTLASPPGELWITDGSPAGTWQIMSGLTAVSAGAALGNAFYFWAAPPGQEGLWRTDGTAAGTSFVHAFPKPLGSITALGKRVLFGAEDASVGYELWASDGTSAGTVLLKDRRPGPLSGVPRALARGRRRPGVLVGARRCQRLRAVVASDGTPAGTRSVEGHLAPAR